VQFTLTDSAGAAISLSGAAIHCELRDTYAGTVLETATCTVTNAAAGIFTVGLSAAETAALTFSRCLYDVLVIYSGGSREYVVRGELTLIRRVTVVA
jgi:hypothetical protein